MPRSYEDYLEFIEIDFDFETYDTWDDAFEDLQEQYNETFIIQNEQELEEYYNNYIEN